MINAYELIYYVHQKDEWALNQLLTSFDPLIKACIKTLIDRSPALKMYLDDLYQELMLSIYEGVDNYRDDLGSTFTSFIKVCLLNKGKCLYRYYHSNRIKANHYGLNLDAYVGENNEHYHYEIISSPRALNDPKDAYDHLSVMERFQHYYKEMDQLDRKVLIYYLKGEKYEKAAKALHMSKKSYDNHIQKVKKRLKAAFRDD
ncbi:MAG: sigma-70 family RNA polymerase sigma factor [Erysipelotrichaceae bacterium]|nr:sigma-70 family RNA polymerase sigma factor [Erysipelotrichaceae bacterium]MDY5252982.1 sigma-70 family RNA polymerase sigma factor [Erysipelotrichaceae bacterium]